MPPAHRRPERTPLPPNAVGGPVPYQRPNRGWNRTMYVGEAAGHEEVRHGYPFARNAVAGSLFTHLLWQAGIDRDQIMLGNAIRYQPQGLKIDLFFEGKRAGVDVALDYPSYKSGYLRSEYRVELNYLEYAIRAIRPALIVALGATALWALTGRDSIKKERGCVFPLRALPGETTPFAPAPVLAVYHPSYIARCKSFGDEEPQNAFIKDLAGPLRDLELARGCPRELNWAALDDPLTDRAGSEDDGGLLDFLDWVDRQRPKPLAA
jgi:DNA polymerase